MSLALGNEDMLFFYTKKCHIGLGKQYSKVGKGNGPWEVCELVLMMILPLNGSKTWGNSFILEQPHLGKLNSINSKALSSSNIP